MVTINVQKPAQIIMPPTVNNIAIVNNAIPQPAFIGHTDYKYTKKGERYNSEVEVENDSLCSFFCETLFENIIDLDYFDNVSLYEYPLREDLSYLEERPIDSLTLMDLSKAMNADAVISLDHLFLSSVLYSEPYDLDFEMKYLDMGIDARFHIYSKEGKLISPPLFMSDTIYWNALYDSRNKPIDMEDSIPSREEAVKQVLMFAAEKIADAFVPSWEDEGRLIFGDNKEANKKVKANDWKGALELWKESFETELKTKKKARLANNIALGYELSDNITEAMKWAKTSVDLFSQSIETSIDKNNLQMATLYLKELADRYRDFRVLDIRGD